MLTQNQQFRAVVEKMIDEEVATESEHLSNGVAASFEDYRNRAGKIAGLRRAKELCEYAETEIQKLHR